MDDHVLEIWVHEFSTPIRLESGVSEDIERVIYNVFNQFDESQEPRFSSFAAIWKESLLGLIFCGRDSFRDLYELSSAVFQEVKQYALATFRQKENNILVRYAALYMLYAFYFKQPCRPRVQIKLSYQEFVDLRLLAEDAKREKHLDILYAWSKLLLCRAFHYSVVGEPKGIEVGKSQEKRESDDFSSAAHSSYFDSKEFKNIVKRMKKCHQSYTKLKETYSKENQVGFSMSSMDPSFIASISKIVEEGELDSTAAGKKTEKSEIGEKRKRLKNKFFASGPSPARATFASNETNDTDWNPSPSASKRKKKRGGGSKKKARQTKKNRKDITL